MNTEPYTQKITPRSLVLFFLLSFGITWGLSVIAAKDLLPIAIPMVLRNISGVLLHYGPALAALILVGRTGGQTAMRSLLAKLSHWRIGFGWYLFIFFYPLLLRLAAAAIDVLLGGQWPPFMSAAGIPAGNPMLLIPLVFLAVFFQAGLAEEIGWRGYALPGLQQRYGALASSLVLGLIWYAWHFHPLNFAAIWPTAFWYLYNILSFTILVTWVYNNTDGSILMAVLFHSASNFSDWVVPLNPMIGDGISLRPVILQGSLGWIVAIAVIVLYGAQQLSRKTHA